MAGIVRDISWGAFRIPLKTPYHLSFVTLEAYAGVWVRFMDDDGRCGVGEAVPLPGYGDETLDDVERVVAELIHGAAGRPVRELSERCQVAWVRAPFAASAVMSALELPELLQLAAPGKTFPLNWPVAGDAEPSALRARVAEGLSKGYRYIKVKVGRDVERELANLPVFFDEFPGVKMAALFDANQGFTWDDALAFARGLAAKGGDRLCWFEQPLERSDWEGHARLCAESPAPLILDESVYSEDDVRRAAAMGAHGVKLKLFKQCGPMHCLALARLACELGLVVVFGNGVATDIGNVTEHLILSSFGGFAAPAESNGFCKLTRSLLFTGLVVQEGCLARTATAQNLAQNVQSFSLGRA